MLRALRCLVLGICRNIGDRGDPTQQPQIPATQFLGHNTTGDVGYSTHEPSVTTTHLRDSTTVGGYHTEERLVSTADISITTSEAPETSSLPVFATSVRRCGGKKIGTYSWSQDYWRFGDSTLIDYLSSELGQEWSCADVTINVGDYSNPDRIHNSSGIVSFIQAYRARVGNYDTVVWCSYGDVVEKSAESLLLFIRTFFAFLASIPVDVADSLGTVGISFDAENFDPEVTKEALLLSNELRSQTTNFLSGKILIQHTIGGAPDRVGTDYIMRYADSVLFMVYRNYMHDPTGKYHDDSNILNRLMWMLTEQCVHCLDDTYAAEKYKAKITMMVEAACDVDEYCGKLSMCAFDRADQGAFYISTILDELDTALIAGSHITAAQNARLFNSNTRFSAHHWEWFRCFAPFSSHFEYPFCYAYHTHASICRSQ